MKCEFCIKPEACMEDVNGPLLRNPESQWHEEAACTMCGTHSDVMRVLNPKQEGGRG